MKIIHPFRYDEVQGYRFGSAWWGKPSLYAHVYFIDGLLIDTGHRNMRKAILNTITQLDVRQIFITHHHEDHTGNLDIFQSHFGCPSYASPLCSEMMKNPPSISFAQYFSWGSRPPNFELIAKERKMDTSRFSFDIIPIPGHAPDMVALHEPNQGWLFSADLWVYDYIRYFMEWESVSQQIQSLKRVLPLEFDALFCGHNPIFKNVKQRIQNKIDFFEEFYGKVARLHHEGQTPQQIMQTLKIREKWFIRLFSTGKLSALNMVRAVIRDEKEKDV